MQNELQRKKQTPESSVIQAFFVVRMAGFEPM
nr:MAG TPA_asm: hypothetical protein [Caudoviricetes sp.]